MVTGIPPKSIYVLISENLMIDSQHNDLAQADDYIDDAQYQ